MLEHQPLRRIHGGLGLVQVGALGQGEQTRDPAQYRIALARCHLGQAARRGIKAMLPAQILKGRPVRSLVADAHDLVDELVRDLVFEHLAHHTPGLLVYQPAGKREGAAAAVPESQTRARIVQSKHRRPQPTAEVVAADLAPGGTQLAQERRFQDFPHRENSSASRRASVPDRLTSSGTPAL